MAKHPSPRTESKPILPGRRVLIATFGSLGDLFPYLAIARELARRGHSITMASCDAHAEAIQAAGFRFASLHPQIPTPEETPELLKRLFDRVRGSQYLIQELLMPAVRRQYEDLLPLAKDADLIISHPVTYAAPIVADRLKLPWVMTLLQPMLFFSSYDPPVPPAAPWLAPLARRFSPSVNRRIFDFWRHVSNEWARPVHQLRAEQGLPPRPNPLMGDAPSPYLNLALFSPLFAAPQPDWPERTLATGFPFYDHVQPKTGLPSELKQFLQAGAPPIVFTLGSSAVMSAGNFYHQSLQATAKLGRRAVLLVGKEGWNELPQPLPKDALAVPYAPHSELFPHAAAIVHSGGVGTTAQGLRSGRPTLIVPFANDQFDNGDRVRRLGAGRWCLREKYAARAVVELRRLLEDPGYERRAKEVAVQINQEDGTRTASDALEALLTRL